MDPDVAEEAGLPKAELIPHRDADVAERLGGRMAVRVGHDEHEIALAGAEG
jgi:hypothetical protein